LLNGSFALLAWKGGGPYAELFFTLLDAARFTFPAATGNETGQPKLQWLRLRLRLQLGLGLVWSVLVGGTRQHFAHRNRVLRG